MHRGGVHCASWNEGSEASRNEGFYADACGEKGGTACARKQERLRVVERHEKMGG